MAVYVEPLPPVSTEREREGGVVTPESLAVPLSTLSQPESQATFSSVVA